MGRSAPRRAAGAALGAAALAGCLAGARAGAGILRGSTAKWDYRGFHRGDWPERGFPLCAGEPAGPEFPHNEWQAPIDVPVEVAGTEEEAMVLEARGGGCNRVGLESDNHTWYASFAMAGCTNLTATWHGRKYTLQQIHFHIESENMLHGHHMDMEVHMVHKSADNRSLVIGLFVQRSHIVVEENRFLDRLLELHYSSDAITSGVLENPYLGTMKTGDRFYSFLGSLTTPPCTPNLEWVLIQDILYVAPRDIQKFEHFLKTRPQADSYGHDDRPVQPLNFRPIKIGKVSAII